jgi:hypothetical protein
MSGCLPRGAHTNGARIPCSSASLPPRALLQPHVNYNTTFCTRKTHTRKRCKTHTHARAQDAHTPAPAHTRKAPLCQTAAAPAMSGCLPRGAHTNGARIPCSSASLLPRASLQPHVHTINAHARCTIDSRISGPRGTYTVSPEP